MEISQKLNQFSILTNLRTIGGDVSILREEETSSLNNYWAMLGRKVGHVDTRLKAVGAREITWEG